MRRILAGLVVALVLGGRLTGQAPAPAGAPVVSALPTLTVEQRLTLGIRVLAVRNAQLELELFTRELARPGYTLDVATGVYAVTEVP